MTIIIDKYNPDLGIPRDYGIWVSLSPQTSDISS